MLSEIMKFITAADPEVGGVIEREFERQQHNIELIASENIASEAVVTAAANVMTNKYAEGLPSARYYGGCEIVDEVERIAIDRACRLFGADHANVQPHSGAQANAAVFHALLQPGDKVLGMKLAHGGHLSHGMASNFSGRYFQVESYGVDEETGCIDYDEVERIAKEFQPKLIIAGASAYPRTIDFERFSQIAKSVGAYLMVDMAHIAGLVAAGEHPSPVPYADVVTTTTHKTLRGPRGGLIFCKQELAKKMDSSVFPRTQGGPLEHVIAGKAVAAAEALEPSFKAYGENVVRNCRAMAEEFRAMGYDLVTGGTDNHLMLLDLTNKNVTGLDLQNALDRCNITLNKNCVPNETRSPSVTSGVRIGTAAMTTKGFGEAQFVAAAHLIDEAVQALAAGAFTDETAKAIGEKAKALIAAVC